MSRGVTREHAALLPRDPSELTPSQITNDLEVHRREALRDERKRKMERAVEAFESPWLVRTEKELQECTVKLNGSYIDQETRASRQAYRDVLHDKLKNFHRNLGALNCEFALDGRRRWCVSQGLLKRPEASRHEPFPVSSHCGGCVRVDRDRRRWQRSSYRSNTTASQNVPSHRGNNSGEKKTQVWRTNSSWQQEAAENNSELF